MFSNSQFTRIAQYNSTLPTLTNGDFSALQVDDQGRLIVSQDVNVSIDFLGLNGAADSSNILVVGTEDGTSSGTAHALRLASNGAVVIDDGGSSITVDAVDLDIRDLSASQDNVAISDGTDTLGIVNTGDAVAPGIVLYAEDDSGNADALNVDDQGRLLVSDQPQGDDANAFSDLATDGVVESIDNSFTDLVTDITVGAGETLEIYGAFGDADKAAFFRVVRKTSSTVDQTYLAGQVFEARSYDPRIPEKCPIRITGGAGVTVNIQARKQQGSSADMSASGAIFARLIS